ncbi:hemerythrin domain-containing protein [Ramlibacter sp. AN1015]|uniref:hemerythrin domain-containing protein n=1 Tax=Ramlibacter sp. AN1015 TaxID=3133428 RepID=UPI0030BB2B08
MPEAPHKDACDLLDADHIAVKHLFVEYARLAMAMPAQSVEQRTALATRICDDLTVHAQIEEEIFYPELRRTVPDASDIVQEGVEEHQEAKDLIARIRGLGSAGDKMDALVSELARAVEHHVKEERDELFPKARSARQLDLLALGERLRERRQALQGAVAA